MSSSDEPTVPAAEDPTSETPVRDQHPVLLYTTWRLAIFIVVLIVLYLVGLRDVWLIVFAFLISGVASIFVLNRRREQAVGGISSLFGKMNDRIDASSRAEDGDDGFLGAERPGTTSESAGEHEPKAE
jgi:hypothetical protein